VKHCQVTIQDLDGISHTVEVTAESRIEAVAQGLAARVSVANVPVQHEIRLRDFTKWLEKAWRIAAGSQPTMGNSQNLGNA